MPPGRRSRPRNAASGNSESARYYQLPAQHYTYSAAAGELPMLGLAFIAVVGLLLLLLEGVVRGIRRAARWLEANRVKVTLADQTSWDATVIGAEPDRDLAVLKIVNNTETLDALSFGKSSALLVGQSLMRCPPRPQRWHMYSGPGTTQPGTVTGSPPR